MVQPTREFLLPTSYQQRVLAELAGVVMARLAPERPPRPSTPPLAPLPDIVTSSTPHTVTLTPPHPPKSHSKRLRSRHAKVLQRFSKLDLAALEAESRCVFMVGVVSAVHSTIHNCFSSTSGSDSENDEFEFYKKSHVSHSPYPGHYRLLFSD